MIELMFVLTTVFVAYVIYSVTQEKQALDKTKRAESQNESPAPPVQAPIAEAPAKPLTTSSRPVAPAQPKAAKSTTKAVKPAVSEAAKPVVAATEAAGANKSTVRDPKTGETASVAGNYRFMKRWVKEALVAEGLLEKVYKNNELDEGAEAKIKQALANLQEIDKYRA